MVSVLRLAYCRRYYNLLTLSIRWIEKSLNLHLNKLLKTEGEDYVIASIRTSYITFDRLVDTVLKRTDESKIIIVGGSQDFLDNWDRRKLNLLLIRVIPLASYVSAYEQKMHDVRVIADKGIWTARKDTFSMHGILKVFVSKTHLSRLWVSRGLIINACPCRDKIKNV